MSIIELIAIVIMEWIVLPVLAVGDVVTGWVPWDALMRGVLWYLVFSVALGLLVVLLRMRVVRYWHT